MSEKPEGWPRFSIITPTYNVASVLPRLIASLRQQTDPNFEWIVSDGNSTDATLQLLHCVDDLDVHITSSKALPGAL